MTVDLLKRETYVLGLLHENVVDIAALVAVEVYMWFRIGIIVEMIVENVNRLNLIDLLEHVECIVNGREREGRILPLQLLVNGKRRWMLDVTQHILDNREPLRRHFETPPAKFINSRFK